MSAYVDPTDALRAIGDLHGVLVRSDNLHDPNVCTSTFDWRESSRSSRPPADRFVQVLRIAQEGYELILRANDRFVAIRLSGEFDTIPFSVNRPDRVIGLRHQTTIHNWPVFTATNAASPMLLADAAIFRTFQALALGPDESLHVYQNALLVYIRPLDTERTRTCLKALIALARVLPQATRAIASSAELPDEFAGLASRFRRWIISDDSARQETLMRASRAELQEFVNAIMPFSQAINRYLDGFGSAMPESAVMLAVLLECADEARLLLATGGPRS